MAGDPHLRPEKGILVHQVKLKAKLPGYGRVTASGNMGAARASQTMETL